MPALFTTRKTPILLLLAMLASGCAHYSPADAEKSAKGEVSEEEKDILKRSAVLAQEMEQKGLIARNPELDAYLAAIQARLYPAVPALKTHVVKSPSLNAFTLPGGDMYFTLGLLARLDNEAQLAFVISHEATHALKKHALTREAEQGFTLRVAGFTDLLLMGSGLIYIPAVANLINYNRDQERDADLTALQTLAARGYDLTKVPGIFAKLNMAKVDKESEHSIWSDHPSHAEREDSVRQYIAAHPAASAPVSNVGDFVAMRGIATRANLAYQIEQKLCASTLEAVEALLAAGPNDPDLYYYKAEAMRCLAEDPTAAAKEHVLLYGKAELPAVEQDFTAKRDSFRDASAESYLKAAALQPAYAKAYRGLGLLAQECGKRGEAVQYFNEYLRADPAAVDRRYIESLINRP